jgi:hypothetical protein
MPSYTITAVSDTVRDWSTKAGVPWKSYRVTLRNEAGAEKTNVEDSRAATDAPPKVGEVVEGTVENREQFGPKLNRPRKGFGGGGGGWKPKPPEERRSIAMQHAQKCAASVLAVAPHTIDGRDVQQVAGLIEEMSWVLFRQCLAAETKDRPDA